jgi:hypothetical protein
VKLSSLGSLKSIVAAIAIPVLLWIGYELATIERLLNKQRAPRRFEYAVTAPLDATFESEMNELGKEGWEIVSARRATSALGAPYEVIMKREVTTQSNPPPIISSHSAPPSPASSTVTDEFRDEQQTLYTRITKNITAQASSGAPINLHVGDLVLVVARNATLARVEVSGKTVIVPLSVTELAEQ